MTGIELPSSFLQECSGYRLYVSFSGGADSTALVHLLYSRNIPFTSVHFVHNIRARAIGEQELAFCRSFCRKLEVPFLSEELNVLDMRHPGEGLEEAARRCRLEAWHRIFSGPDRSKECPPAVVTAHHGDDVRENILLRLFRGGNASSLSGLRSRSEVNGITFLHPLLSFSKANLIRYLTQHGVTTWNEDATNAEDDAARNFLRNRILPMIGERLPFAPGGILTSAENLACDASFLEETAEKTAREQDLSSAAVWRAMHPAVRIRVLRLWLTETTGQAVIPDWRMAERFEEMLSLPRTRRVRRMPVAGARVEITRTGEKIEAVRVE